ncbi:sigma 54-interacting transcriptional regulator [Dissulfurispira thermophila]|uniref:sigma 54-interacting transcriptional regulator n=1 Tax=Dissulfurispira thermophila TaxID=2715679 RepID=UPI00193E180D|nr:sigma 54-interacting transcriptional regulator [Dissulfurispira thermophila]
MFEHTISSLHAIVNNEKEPLQKVSRLIKYDPGLYFSLLEKVNSLTTRAEITSISQAISLIGAEGIENHILEQDFFLDEDYILLWCYAVLSGEAASIINEKADIAEDEEAFFAGIMSCIGILFMYIKHPKHKKICDLLLRVPVEHKIFIEEKLFKTNLLKQLDKNITSPQIYRELINIMNFIFSDDGQRVELFNHPARFSANYKSYQLFQLLDVSEHAARSILFPAVVEAQEKFREMSKRYFKIPENEVEELLADIVERFEDVCKEFKVGELSEKFITAAEQYHFSGISFLTKSEPLKESLEKIYAANREEKNIFIYGETNVGKRLLAVALHNRPDNPRKTKPFLSIHCGALDSETLELELFGAKGGFLGKEKHKGALELANGGTILLKDIDRIPLTFQDKLSEIFCKDEFYKIGETRLSFFDVRFFITSRKNIFEEAKEARFSERLLRVLKPVSIYIPPLRERREDIEFIGNSIIEKYNLNLTDKALLLGLKEYYETHAFQNNLKDLKRLLFYLAAKHRLES